MAVVLLADEIQTGYLVEVDDPWGWGGPVTADVVTRNPAGLLGPGMLMGGLCGTVEVLTLSGTVEGVTCG